VTLLLGEKGRNDLWLLPRVVCFAAVVPALTRLPLPRLTALLAKADGKRRSGRAYRPSQVVRCVEAAQRWGRPFVRGGCLTRGVTLYWFLRRNGCPVELCFGVGPVDGDIAGHCWLVLDGEAFCERSAPDERFVIVYRIPGSSKSEP
jgi:hypothetical protein